MHPDLLIAQAAIYQPCNFTFENYAQEDESQEYAASRFELNCKSIVFRTGKITPTKIGQFVTLWKRIGNGPIMPFDMTDQFDFCIISVRSGERLGQFVFPKAVLFQQGILSKNGVGGKRAIRVYPPWDIPNNMQATKTQAWQTNYFFQVDTDRSTNLEHIGKLFE